jgi:hypothetical protein
MAYIGSNNLTTGGLETNFECGVELDLRSPEDDALIEELEDMWNETRDRTLELDEELLQDLQEANLVVSEQETRVREEAGERTAERVEGREYPDFPQTDVRPPSPIPQREQADTGDAGETTEELAKEIAEEGQLVWEKGEMARRGAQRPGGEKSNPTGVMALVQDGFKDEEGKRIDKTTYFRNRVFGNLEWFREGKKEISEAKFKIFIDGNYVGTKILRISHDPDWESNQNNYTTAIHWGPEMNNILKNDVNVYGWKFSLFEVRDDLWEIRMDPPEED